MFSYVKTPSPAVKNSRNETSPLSKAREDRQSQVSRCQHEGLGEEKRHCAAQRLAGSERLRAALKLNCDQQAHIFCQDEHSEKRLLAHFAVQPPSHKFEYLSSTRIPNQSPSRALSRCSPIQYTKEQKYSSRMRGKLLKSASVILINATFSGPV